MSQNTSGLSNKQQAILMALALALASGGALTTMQGMITSTEWKEIIGVASILGGIASASIKEFVGIMTGQGGNSPQPQGAK